MSYTPTDWKTGDIITAEKLNKLEQGVSGGEGNSDFYIVNIEITGMFEGATCDKTVAEMQAAVADGKILKAYLTSNLISNINIEALSWSSYIDSLSVPSCAFTFLYPSVTISGVNNYYISVMFANDGTGDSGQVHYYIQQIS